MMKSGSGELRYCRPVRCRYVQVKQMMKSGSGELGIADLYDVVMFR